MNINNNVYRTLKTLNAAWAVNRAAKRAYVVVTANEMDDHVELPNFKLPRFDHSFVSWTEGRGNTEVYVYGSKDDRKELYRKKVRLLNLAINSIKYHGLPIKYGKTYDDDGEKVIIFEFKGVQVSFHEPNNYFKKIKNFNGYWNGRCNKNPPFAAVLAKDGY